MTSRKQSITYKRSGVDINKADRFVEMIKPLVRPTLNRAVIGGIGGFSALYQLANYREPVLASSTDGVGTKLKLAHDYGWVDGIGTDCVAMVLNDIVPCGARPLFFLDYYACGELNPKFATKIIRSIASACKTCDTALVGGETAEMPGVYQKGDFDLAGFGVGVVERSDLIDGSQIQVGDAIISLPSSGFHSNGFSLIRRVVAQRKLSLSRSPAELSGRTPLGRRLLEPTRLYVPIVMRLLEAGIPIHAMAHNTGGGVVGNLPRVYGKKFRAHLLKELFSTHPLTEYIAHHAELGFTDKVATFNCGHGYFLIIPERALFSLRHLLTRLGEPMRLVGRIEARKGGQPDLTWS